jgi:DNA-binding NarL/FixJ family response regulator
LINVLIVDDHALFSAGLRSRLEQERDVGPINDARTPEQALLKARALQPDVVLLDLLLPPQERRRPGSGDLEDRAAVAHHPRFVASESNRGAPGDRRRSRRLCAEARFGA